jgi:cyclophilin family peptidyl-prolyl cis-trans isomerase
MKRTAMAVSRIDASRPPEAESPPAEENPLGTERHLTVRWTLSIALVIAGLAILGTGCQMRSGSGSSASSGSTGGSGSTGSSGGSPSSQPATAKQWSSPPAMTIDANKTYTAKISTTMGDMEAQLNAREAPQTVNNFVFLAREGFYDNVKFHRIIKNFMVQTGDPTGTGRGGPGYRFVDEPVTLDYDKGVLAMANSGPNTNGSQFFIVHGEDVNQRLPKNYTIFGKITAGMDVLDKIANVSVSASPSGEPSVPQQDVRITGVTITEQ